MAKLKTYRLVAVDETQHWCDTDLVAAAGGRIWTTYAYDPGEATHLCEITPSYYLVPVEFISARVQQWTEDPQEQREFDEMRDTLDYEFMNQEPMYMHCPHVERLPTKRVRFDADTTLDGAAQSFREQGICPKLPLA